MSMGRVPAPERDNQESLLLVFHIIRQILRISSLTKRTKTSSISQSATKVTVTQCRHGSHILNFSHVFFCGVCPLPVKHYHLFSTPIALPNGRGCAVHSGMLSERVTVQTNTTPQLRLHYSSTTTCVKTDPRVFTESVPGHWESVPV